MTEAERKEGKKEEEKNPVGRQKRSADHTPGPPPSLTSEAFPAQGRGEISSGIRAECATGL